MDNPQTETTVNKPAKRKAAKRKPRAAPAPKPAAAASGPFAGMTVTDCCDGCSVDGCVISGKAYCAHPRKGGLHSSEIQDSEALKRLNKAKRMLGEQMLQARGDA